MGKTMKKYNKEKIQKDLNYWLKKKYRYQKIGFEDGVLECEAFIALLENRLLDSLDYFNEIKKRKKEYYSSFARIMKIYHDEKESNNKNTYDITTKSLMDLTKEEAEAIGGETLKKFRYIEDKLCLFLSSKIHKATIIECDTLRELSEICKTYVPSKK